MGRDPCSDMQHTERGRGRGGDERRTGASGHTHAGGGGVPFTESSVADGVTGGSRPCSDTCHLRGIEVPAANPCWALGRYLSFPAVNSHTQSSGGSGAKSCWGLVLNACSHLPSNSVLLGPLNTSDGNPGEATRSPSTC